MALVSLRHSLSEGERISSINSSYTQHITQAKVLREAYNTNIDKATLLWQALCRHGVKMDESQNRPGYPYLNTQIVQAFHNKEMPLTIVPKGLTPARAQYLYDKVRKYVPCQSN